MKLLALVAVAAFALAGSASAATYDFSFTASDPDYQNFSFVVNTDSKQSLTSLNAGDPPKADFSTTDGDPITFYDEQLGQAGFGRAGGGFDYQSLVLSGDVLYTAGSATPHFNTGTFNLNAGRGETSVGSITVRDASVSAAPEPGTWALMLGGVAMLGAMLRIRKARREEDAVSEIATA